MIADSARLQDELSQFTPPKRRKLAARRRRHPAGDSSSSNTMAMLEDETCGSSSAGPTNQHRNRKQCTNRPRRRRRANAFYSTSVPPERKDQDVKRTAEAVCLPSTFIFRFNTFIFGAYITLYSYWHFLVFPYTRAALGL